MEWVPKWDHISPKSFPISKAPKNTKKPQEYKDHRLHPLTHPKSIYKVPIINQESDFNRHNRE